MCITPIATCFIPLAVALGPSLIPVQCDEGPFSFAFPPCSRIIDKMHDSSSGIRPSPNMEQGSTYKKTFIGEHHPPQGIRR